MKPNYKTDHHRYQERQSIRKVPILKPQQIEKLDNLKKYTNNTFENRARESYRPSKGAVRPSKSLKSGAHKSTNYHESNKKSSDREGEESSGLTKQLTLRSNQKGQPIKKRMTRAIHQQQQDCLKSRCCDLFKAEEKNIESPFKAARQASFRK